MPKFDFSNSRYPLFWDSKDSQEALTVFLNTPELFEQNYMFWATQFIPDSVTQPRGADGTAQFKTLVKERNQTTMLNMRSPLGDTTPREKANLAFYTGSIPDFIANGFVETAMEREAKERMFAEYFGNDAAIISAFADDIQSLLDDGNQTMSNMAAQLLSTGYINYTYGNGVKSVITKAPIPAANRVKAGAAVWSADESCKILDQMREIEEKYRQDHGLENAAIKWQMPRSIFYNVFLKNPQVIERVRTYRKVNNLPYDSTVPTEEMFRQAFASNDLIAPIEVITEKQKDGSAGFVRGWKEGIVVLRPDGFAGSIKRASLLDQTIFEKYGSSAISKVFAQKDIYTIVNTTINNGMLKEWHTDLIVSAVPALEEFVDHLIVDTTEADA